MTFDDVIAASQAPERLSRFIECFNVAQASDGIGVQSALPLRDFARFMPDITLLEMVEEKRLLYRLAGENVLEKLGRDLVGRDFLDIIPSAMRDQSINGHIEMRSRPCGYFMIYENEYLGGQRALAETLTLPLRKTPDGERNFFLGFHIQNELTSVELYPSQPALIVGHALNSYVDIGYGTPEELRLPKLVKAIDLARSDIKN